MANSFKAFGPYAEWALLPVAIMASIRLWLDGHRSQSLPSNCSFVLQSPRRQEHGLVADFEVFERDHPGGERRLFLRGEYKLTQLSGILRLKDSLRQVREQALPPNALLIVATHGSARQTTIKDQLVSELRAEYPSSDMALEVWTLPEDHGCFLRGTSGTMNWEAMVCDLDRVFDCLALGLLREERRHKPERAIGRLLQAATQSIADPQFLEELLAQKELSLDLSNGFWQARLPVAADAFIELLLHPLEKVLRDFLRMSVRNGSRHYGWTRSLLRLSHLRPITLWNEDRAEAMERTMSPLPVRLGTKRNGLSIHSPGEPDSLGSGPTRIVIESRAGAGKSTLLGFLKWLETQRMNHHGSLLERPVVSFLLDLQRYRDSDFRYGIEVLLESDRPSNWKDRRNIFGSGLDAAGLEVLLANWPVDIFIDGYDHLRTLDDQEHLSGLGVTLSTLGTRLQRLIVTSRPGFEASRLWSESFALTTQVIRNAHIDSASIPNYVETWFGIVELLDKDRYIARFKKDTPRIAAIEFIKYLGNHSRKEEGDVPFSEVVKETPLLLTIAMATFFNLPPGQPQSLSTNESKLFEAMLTQPVEIEGDIGKRLSMNLDPLGALSFTLLMNVGSFLGEFTDDSPITIEGSALSVKTWSHYSSLNDVSIIESTPGADGGAKRWHFLHPSFQEYLACRYLVSRVELSNSNSLTIPGRDQTPVSPLAIVSTAGFSGSHLAEIMTRLGSQALKFIVGRASDQPGAVRALLDALSLEFGLQQYLYDTECLAPAESELKTYEAGIVVDRDADETTVRIKALLNKLIGHLHYASFESNELSRQYLAKVLDLCTGRTFEGNDWYRLFCIDHIQNRAKGSVRKRYSDEFEAAIQHLDHEQRSGVRLRLAHFAGHRGNQALREIDSAKAMKQDRLSKCIEQGELEYTRAIEWRALTFSEAIGEGAPAQLVHARDRFLEIAGVADPNPGGVRTRDDHRDREHFVGPSQAIGDFAHQLVGRAAIRFWKVVEQRISGGSHETASQIAGAKDLELATLYWRLANERMVRAVRGERIIKYVIYLAGARARQDILDNCNRPWKVHKAFLDAQINDVAREFQISVPMGGDHRQVVAGVERFAAVTRRVLGAD